jgi:hypothetical protein
LQNKDLFSPQTCSKRLTKLHIWCNASDLNAAKYQERHFVSVVCSTSSLIVQTGSASASGAKAGCLARHQQADDEAKQTQNGAENLNDENLDKPAVQISTHVSETRCDMEEE